MIKGLTYRESVIKSLMLQLVDAQRVTGAGGPRSCNSLILSELGRGGGIRTHSLTIMSRVL